MRRHWDIVVGAASTSGIAALSGVTSVLTVMTAFLTVVLLSFRIRREWLRRHDFRRLPGEPAPDSDFKNLVQHRLNKALDRAKKEETSTT